MLTSLIPLLLVVAGPVVKTDTSFSVPTGSRLAIHNFSGAVVVRAGDRNVLRIQATHALPVRIYVSQEGSSYDVRARGRHMPNPPVNYQITAPSWMPLDLEGFHCDMDIDGSRSDVMVETIRGGVKLRGGQGLIRLSSLTGGVDVIDATGRLQLSSVASGIGVHNVEGEISIEAVNGNVVLDRVRTRMLEAATVNGDVAFTGWIEDAGRYRLVTHRGNVDMLLPPEADATVLVSTFSGGFQSAFPVRHTAFRPGRNFSFTLREGRAQVDLQSFEGRINLRQGQPPSWPPVPPGPPGVPVSVPPPSDR